jgi:4-diphosphocytidyl-2-C-methyl-D-erythritol kinase
MVLAVAAELAPAKVNLALHVTGRRADGYHLLDSVVVFPRLGDRLEAEPSASLGLAIDGPFARHLASGHDNLVLRAAMLLRPPGRGAALRLTKVLPVASGVGGGSADAAAALRLLARLWDVPLPGTADLLGIGADLPVCLDGRACRMRGIGERLEPFAAPPVWLVLANPGVPVPTGPVFARLARTDNAPLPSFPAFTDAGALGAYLAGQRNDLEAPAMALVPAVANVVAALAAQPGCLVARMSGSGATCFGLFARQSAALAAQAALQRAEPGWWVAAGPAGDDARR